MIAFGAIPLPANLAIFSLFAVAVWFAGTRLSYLADAIGDNTGIGRAMMGLLFLAAITSLPELVTTVTASIKGDAALALNNIFGGIVMQTAILAVADAFVIHAAITAFPRKPTEILEGVILILLLTAILGIIFVGEVSLIDGLGLGTVFLAGTYVFSIFILQRYERGRAWRPVDLPEPKAGKTHPRRKKSFGVLPLRTLVLHSIAAAGVILVCGVMLVESAQTIAEQSGLGSSFIGVTLLAASTSLPELSTTIAAVRMGAYTMAISNIFGSNLIMVLMLFPADIFYRQGEILHQADDAAQLALLSGIFVTTIYVIGLLIKKKPRILGMGVDSVLVLAVYFASIYAFYSLR